MAFNPIEVQTYLKGLDYPATKNDLINKARENGAPSEVMETLENLPEHEFTKPNEVVKAMAEVRI